MGPTAVDGASETFQVAGRKTTVFMASVRVKVIPTSTPQYASSPCTFSPGVLWRIHFQRLRSVGPINRPVRRETERKLATGQYIIASLGRSPSSDCSSIQRVRWCLSQVTTSCAEHSPSVSSKTQLGIETWDCIVKLRTSVSFGGKGRLLSSALQY